MEILKFTLLTGLVLTPFPLQPHFACPYFVTRQTPPKEGHESDTNGDTAADAFEDIFREESDTDSLVMDVPIMSGGNGQ